MSRLNLSAAAPSIAPDGDDNLADLDLAIAALERIRDRMTGGRQSARAVPNQTTKFIRPMLLSMDQYKPDERISLGEAAKIAKKHVNTIRNWVENESVGWIGRRGKYRRFTVCKPLLLDLLSELNLQRKL